jgi:endo-1,4-beta-mannosidase
MLTGYHVGGMDLYVQEFGVAKTHDEFYTDMTIRREFYKYVQFVVSRYVNEPGIIAWELANDARCNSTLPSSDLCNTNTVTLWHAETAEFIRSIDPNHLITSGCASILLLPDDLLNYHPQQDPWLLLSNMPQVILASAYTSTTAFACSRKYS